MTNKLTYDAYIAMIDNATELRALSNYDAMRDDMNELDAYDELIESHDASTIIDESFIIAHCIYSSRAMMHYALTDFNCRCTEFCAQNACCNARTD